MAVILLAQPRFDVRYGLWPLTARPSQAIKAVGSKLERFASSHRVYRHGYSKALRNSGSFDRPGILPPWHEGAEKLEAIDEARCA
jgi:hypothetical protein